jgi:hypothetical protein
MPDRVPVAAPNRRAIDQRCQAKGLGRALCRDAARRVLAAADSSGIHCMPVHGIGDEAKICYVHLWLHVSPLEPMP